MDSSANLNITLFQKMHSLGFVCSLRQYCVYVLGECMTNVIQLYSNSIFRLFMLIKCIMDISKVEKEQRSTETYNTIEKSEFCDSIYIQLAYFVCELN